VVLPGGPDARPTLDAAACFVALRHARSPIHRWGIFASEDIPAGRRVIEYTGQRVSPDEAARRSLRSQLYLFYLSPTQQIDGAIGGSGAEYINHSCEPNLRAAVSSRRLYLLSVQPIESGEELLLDYRISSDGPRVACHCGTASCRGYLNMSAQT
jgi:SET domain-containing protein